MHYIRITHTRKIKLASGTVVDLTNFVASLDDLAWTTPHYADGTNLLTKEEAVKIAMDGVFRTDKGIREPAQFYTYEDGKLAMVNPRWPKTAATHTAANGFLESDADGWRSNNLDNLPDA